ncbi:hypothetical protein [Candidatus Binatus sp.]|jgi:hypothetical protein|uniref:hypothetical protein n=1 Tax=Candidatus Binatus sp. TaxID=2811406 RepID=UPI003BC5CF8C
MATEKWPSKDEYVRIRETVAQTEEGRELIKWAETIERPKDADDLALRLAGTVITSGFGSHSRVYERVAEAFRAGTPIYQAFPNKKKARAIERIRSDRDVLFERFKRVHTERQASAWCDGIPYVQGPAIRYQAMRDLGAADVAKPDRHMLRIAERACESVAKLCARLAKLTGDRIGTVDAVLWYAASVGIIEGISRRPRCR